MGRSERLVDKATRRARKIARKLSDEQSGPRFVWVKNIEQDISTKKLHLKDLSLEAEKRRQVGQLKEIERIRNRRAQVAAQRAEREELLRRSRHEAPKSDEQEPESPLILESLPKKQAHLIHVLEKGLLADSGSQEERPFAHEIFKHLNLVEIQELRDDLHIQEDLKGGRNAEFWEALRIICDFELATREELSDMGGVHRAVDADLRSLLQNLSINMIEAKERRIHLQMQSGEAKNVEFYEAVLKKLPYYKACAKIRQLSAHLPPDWQQEIDDRQSKAKKSLELEEGAVELHDIPLDDVDRREEEESGKPKFLTIVHLGYEWNKYNQTHYDHDNPPPKHVQGYKFNVFYPKLKGTNQTPKYTVLPDKNADTCILRFSAAPAYQDIAFRIVNRDWDYSHKKGFRCTFDGGVLRLHFQLKKYRYRR